MSGNTDKVAGIANDDPYHRQLVVDLFNDDQGTELVALGLTYNLPG